MKYTWLYVLLLVAMFFLTGILAGGCGASVRHERCTLHPDGSFTREVAEYERQGGQKLEGVSFTRDGDSVLVEINKQESEGTETIKAFTELIEVVK